MLESTGSAIRALEQEHGLLADELTRSALADLDRWSDSGIRVCSVLDRDYPANLRAAHDRPPLIFLLGSCQPRDTKSVAVIGARRASPVGLARARAVSEHLVGRGYTVVSGLAAGIDTVAHTAALASGGRTIAVIGTGVLRTYPAENAALQRQIAETGALISQFLPDAPATRTSFPKRNAVMSGLTRATVVIEASATSGARAQARLARAQDRPVFLAHQLLEQRWAKELAAKSGVHVFAAAPEITTVIERLGQADGLVA